MARISVDPAPPYACPECQQPGIRGRLKDGPLAECCSRCLIALNGAIARWKMKETVAHGDLPF